MKEKKWIHIHRTIDTNTATEEAYVVEKEIPGAEVKWIHDANHRFEGKENIMVKAAIDWLSQKLL